MRESFRGRELGELPRGVRHAWEKAHGGAIGMGSKLCDRRAALSMPQLHHAAPATRRDH